MSQNQTSQKSQNRSSFVPHLLELRSRLTKILLSVLVIFTFLIPFSGEIYNILSIPLLNALPEGSEMIAIDVASPFLIPFKLVIYLSIFLVIPYILFHLWSFIAPGLYTHEKKLIFPLIISSSILFYLGAAFAYFVVFPLIFVFLHVLSHKLLTVVLFKGNTLPLIALGSCFKTSIALALNGTILSSPFLA